MSFPGGSEVKASACNTGDPGSIPGLGRSLGEGNGNPLQYSCLENPMDRGAWSATVHGFAKSRTRLSDFTSLHAHCSTGGGYGNPLLYPCIENPMDRGAWQATVHTGSPSVGHNWSHLACTHAYCSWLRKYRLIQKNKDHLWIISPLKVSHNSILSFNKNFFCYKLNTFKYVHTHIKENCVF